MRHLGTRGQTYTTSKILENISLALLRSSLRKPYANPLKTKAVNAKTRPTCALVAGFDPLSLLFVCLTSLMEFEIHAEHAQKPRMCRRILGDAPGPLGFWTTIENLAQSETLSV